MSNRSKGKRREREAAELYERAGYDTFRPQESKFGETDVLGLFDILALYPIDAGTDPYPSPRGEPVRLVQVKSNTASGIREWVEQAVPYLRDTVRVEYLVATDRKGWRLMVPVYRDGAWTYRTVVDERGQDCDMGEAVVGHLRG